MWSLIACSGFPKKDLNGSGSSDFLTCSFTASKPGIGSFADCAWKSIFSWTYNKPIVIRALKWNNTLWTKIADETGFRKSKSEVLLRHYSFWRASYASYPQNSFDTQTAVLFLLLCQKHDACLERQVRNFPLVHHWVQFFQLKSIPVSVLGACDPPALLLGHDLCICSLWELRGLWWARQHLLHL